MCEIRNVTLDGSNEEASKKLDDMIKELESKRTSDQEIEEMSIMQELIARIEKDLFSEDANDCIYAIRACCLKKISTDIIVSRLKVLTKCSACAMMSKISDCAIAALDILGFEKYSGNEPKILDIIETSFYSN